MVMSEFSERLKELRAESGLSAMALIILILPKANITRILRISLIRLRIYLIQNFEFHIKRVPKSVLFLILFLLPVFFD